MKGTTDDLRIELSFLRDNLLEAITQGKTGQVKDGLSVYGQLIEAFLEELARWGEPYDKERALTESSSLEGGWSEVEWIRSDFRDIIDSAVRTENLSVLDDILYFPIQMALLAFKHRDYYVFHEFTGWIPYSYHITDRIRDDQVRTYIIDRSSRWLREATDLFMLPELERIKDPEALKKTSEFVVGMIRLFSELLKISLDRRAQDDFDGFVHVLQGLFRYFGGDHDLDSAITSRELHLELSSGNQQEELTAELNRMRTLREVRSRFERKRAVALFGLEAWMIHLYEDGKLEAAPLTRWRHLLPPPSSVREEWAVFQEARKHETSDEFRWHWWESEERPESEVGTLKFSYYLERLWTLRVLSLLAQLPPDQDVEGAIAPSDELRYLADPKDGPLQAVLKMFETNPEKWAPVLGDSVSAIPRALSLLEELHKRQIELEAQEVRDAPLSPSKIAAFKEAVSSGWEDESRFRRIVKTFGSYEFIEESPADVDLIGLNVLDLKDLYVEGTRFGDSVRGRDYGREVARAANEIVLTKVTGSLSERDAQPNHSVVSAVDALIEELKGYSPLILVLNAWTAERELETSDYFQHLGWNRKDFHPLGHYRGLPVLALHSLGKAAVAVVDLKRLGKWMQYRPRQVMEGEEYIRPELTLYLRSLTIEDARRMIEEKPERLLDEEGQPRERDQVLSELQQRVHLRLAEQLEFRVLDSEAGRLLRLGDG